uniref:Uncharacterized protein n=1 Tax=viral metagenome TaxID=1070528 RepID=A0A6M3JME5_9ZZZZ
MSKYAGSEWIKVSLKKKVSPLGENVADLLGDVFFGIYHLSTPALCRVEWDDIEVILLTVSYKPMATVDGDELTRLVVGCHDRMLRMDMKAVAPNRLRLMFHQRQRDGDFYHRCPTMEAHLEQIRAHQMEYVTTSSSALDKGEEKHDG